MTLSSINDDFLLVINWKTWNDSCIHTNFHSWFLSAASYCHWLDRDFRKAATTKRLIHKWETTDERVKVHTYILAYLQLVLTTCCIAGIRVYELPNRFVEQTMKRASVLCSHVSAKRSNETLFEVRKAYWLLSCACMHVCVW